MLHNISDGPDGSDADAVPAATGPLRGVRVLDLSRVIMGPLATQILGDQGADVIMLEAPEGDTSRVMGYGPHDELSGLALNLLRNKRSVVVDFKTPEGMQVVHRLVRWCDVVVATMRPAVLTRLGLDYQSLRRLRPDLVYCQAQGYPLDSERADDPAYDDIIQAATGVCDIMTRVFGQPALLPTIIADKACGLVVAQAVTAALFHRERTGEGQHLEVPMVQAMTSFMLIEHGNGAIASSAPRPDGSSNAGYTRVLSRERRAHPTKDGYVHMLPYLPKHYAALFTAAGIAGAEGDPRYTNMRAALQNSDSLYQDVRRVCASRTTQEWLTFCTDAGIPVTPLVTLDEMVRALPKLTHPHVGDFHVTPTMVNFAATPTSVRRTAPLIGEHTEQVLHELGLARPGSPSVAEREPPAAPVAGWAAGTHDLVIAHHDAGVASLTIVRPPNNFFDLAVIGAIAEAAHRLADDGVRVIVLRSEGRHFCAGADLTGGDSTVQRAATARALYARAVQLFQVVIPMIAAVQGAAVGGGLGLACAADFRVAEPRARFHANFSRLGFHQGFGLSVTLPHIVGHQRALDLLYRSDRVTGAQAHEMGLVDRLAPAGELLGTALQYANEIAAMPPLAIRAMKRTQRRELVDAVRVAVVHEADEQERLWATEDCALALRTAHDPHPPIFSGR